MILAIFILRKKKNQFHFSFFILIEVISKKILFLYLSQIFKLKKNAIEKNNLLKFSI